MTRYEAIEKALRKFVAACNHAPPVEIFGYLANACQTAEAALALPEDSKTVNAELYGLAVEMADQTARVTTAMRNGRGSPKILRYLSLREASGEPMPYKVVRDGDKVRFL